VRRLLCPHPRRGSGGFLIADFSAAAGTMTWKVTGTSSKQVKFTWGDGADTTLTMTGSEQTLTHNYTKASFNLRISGDTVTKWQCNNAQLKGDVADLPTGAATYSFYNTSISGDVADLPTGAVNYYFSNTSISGDLNVFATLGTEIDLIYLYGCINITGYTSATLQNISADNAANIRVYNLGLTSTEVDNFIIDLAAAQTGDGYLSIGGTNAARTSASNAAVAALLALGWDVLVNE